MVLDPLESAKLLAETFYPEDAEEEDNDYHREIRRKARCTNEMSHTKADDPPFTMQELKFAVTSFNPKKAPGGDGLTADICEHAVRADPELLLTIVNKCLKLRFFPAIWKRATVVILRKPAKEDYSNPKSYRPIGLLPVLGKIFEKMLVVRLKHHLIPRMSTRQYGFMPQKSTEDSLYDLMTHVRYKLGQKRLVLVVSLDIEGAFDNAWWPMISVRLIEEECPENTSGTMDSLLSDRTVTVRYAGHTYSKATNKGCVQGSISGPILWNLIIDPLLQELAERDVYGQAFADDVTLVFDAETALEVQQKANVVLEYVREWGVRNKLKFAPHKTNAMVITRKLKYDTPLLRMGGIDIKIVREMKLLGLLIDDKLTFNSHITSVCQKAIKLYKRLSRAARVSWGLHPEVIRTIYIAVIEPTIMYAASAWAPSTSKLKTVKQFNVVQRSFAQKLTKAYKTVSLNSALVLAGILPLDLRIREAAALYEIKRGVSRRALGDRETEARTPFAQTPHPAANIDLEFMSLVDQQSVDAINTQSVRIYTDGSKIEGKVGAAVSIWNREQEIKSIKLKLAPHCTVYQAELLAIWKATGEILKRPETSFGIYSDSRSALQSLINQGSTHCLATQARQNLWNIRKQHKVVDLCWIKAHAGFEGNERADQLAKEAALRKKTAPDYELCPTSFVKRAIRRETLDDWNRRYKEQTTASTTKLFFPDAVAAYKVVRKLEINNITTQILTGHGGFAEYLNRFKCSENPACACDANVKESVEHVLFECPIYGRHKYETEHKTQTSITRQNAPELISNRKTRDTFIKYARDIVQKVNAKNKT